jgi:YD repeat-containing protein
MKKSDYSTILLARVIFIILLTTSFKIFSQVQQSVFDKLKNVPIISPHAASIAKHTEFPISFYNGTAQISIPLYTIETGDITLPISISYHSGGIRVAEEASWVGLGWNLQAGGAITRQIKGKDDHTLTTNFFDEIFPGGTNGRTFNANHKNIARAAVCSAYDSSGNVISTLYPNPDTELRSLVLDGDGEPDVYLYNFGNYSGKFIDVGSKIYDLSRNNIRFIVTITKITAITPDGDKYEFSDLEKNWVGTNPQSITSYFLSKITSSTGTEISFQYEYLNNKVQLPSYSEEFTASKPVTSGSLGSPGVYGRSYSGLNANYLILDKITFSEGYVDFIPGTREDMDNKKLNAMEVRYWDGSLLKRISFNHSYFVATSSNHYLSSGGPAYPIDFLSKRLKLTGISEIGNNFSDKTLTHEFEYYEGGNYDLPYKTSYAVDFFGFYNGKTTNTTFIPSTQTFLLPTEWDKIKNYAGSNRDPDASFVKAGTLKKVTYPTKGWTEYEHSIHSYSNSEVGPQKYTTTIIDLVDYSTGAKERIFDHPGGEMQIDVNLYCDCAVNACICDNNNQNPNWTCGSVKDNGYSLNALYAELRKFNTSTGQYEFINWDLNWELYDILPCSLNGNGIFQTKVTLPAGKYKMIANYPDNKIGEIGAKMASIRITYVNYYYELNPIGGGLRVSKIKNYDPDKQQYLSRTFEYTDGKLMFFPKFYWRTLSVKLETPQGSISEFRSYVNEYLYSNPVIPFSSSANGSTVGYGKVTEIIEGGEVGKIEYLFENTADNINNGPVSNYPSNAFIDSHAPGIPTTPNLTNGFLKEKTVLSNTNIPVKKTISTPSVVIPQTFWAFKGQRVNMDGNDFNTNNCDPANATGSYFLYFFYPIQIGKVLPSKIVEKEYLNGVETLATTKDYQYNLQAFPKLETITNSDGKVYTSEYKYLRDYNNGANAWITDLYNKNITDSPIEVMNKVGADVVGGSFIEHKTTGSFTAPNKVYSIETVIPKAVPSTAPSATLPNTIDYKLEGTIDYNVDGNINYTQASDDVITGYIWGYNKMKPVGIVQNALPTSVYYNSFEDLATGYSTTAKTGKKSSSASFTVPVPATGSGFKLAYWKKVGTGKWEYVIEDYTVSKQIGGVGTIIDEVRVYPSNSSLTTYTYDLLMGITSVTDPNGKSTYYEYDTFGRLKLIRDDNNNIINQYTYHYKE